MLRRVGSTYREAFSGLPRQVWWLALATLINRSGTMVIPFLALFLTKERGMTSAEAGVALALYGLGGVGGSWLGGWFSDRIDPRRLMAGSLAGAGAGFLILDHLEHRAALLALLFLTSLVGESFRPANLAALSNVSSPADRSRSFALNRLAINLGMSVGPAVGGFLALIDYGWLFVVDGLTCLAAAAFLAFAPAFSGMGRVGGRSASPLSGDPALRERIDGPLVAFLLLLAVLAMIFFQSTNTYALTLNEHYHFSEAWIGLLTAINTLVIVAFEMVLVHGLRSRDPVRVVSVGAVFTCLGFGLLPLGRSYAFVAGTVLIWTVGEMLSFSVASAAIANRASDANRGRYLGYYTLVFAVALVLSPLAGTWIYERLGYAAVWYGCLALALPLGGGFWWVSLSWREPRNSGIAIE